MKQIQYQKREGHRILQRTFVEPENVQSVDQFLDEKSSQPEPHGNSKQVLISEIIDEDLYNSFEGTKPIGPRILRSAAEASSHFGYNCNHVAIALSNAKRKGKNYTIIRGLMVQYADYSPGQK